LIILEEILMHPYIAELGDRDPVMILTETPPRLRELVASLGDDAFTRTYEAGKWTVQQIIAHLLHAEIAFNFRIRQALAVEHYVAQSFDQDDWMKSEAATDGAATLEAYGHLRQFNLALYRSLSAADHARPFLHPELGEMNVGLILQLMAGHELRHLSQLDRI
jgi:uncharacterized damage-inducible protein DinB